MIKRDLESITALGRSLTAARDSGVIAPKQFAQSARALVVAMLTGSMEMEAYAGIHWVLGQMLEAAFSSPSKARGENLDDHMEVVGRMWNYVGPTGEPLASVDRFFSRVFDMEKSSFGQNPRFSAPLKVDQEELGSLLRASGIIVISSNVSQGVKHTRASLADVKNSANKSHIILGWGERRMALLFPD